MHTIIVTNVERKEFESVWYKVGQIFEVRQYRHSDDYWELLTWNGYTGDGDNTGHKFWILKRHAKIIEPGKQIVKDDLFVVE